MTKVFKRITAFALASVTAGAISAVAYAATDEGEQYKFNIYGYGHYEYSNPAAKKDKRDYATIFYDQEESIISETHFMYLTVCSYSGNPGSPITETIQVTSRNDIAAFLKYESTPKINSKCCLKGQIGYYDAKLSGTWIP